MFPTHECAEEVAERFVDYFSDKIRTIRLILEGSTHVTPDHLRMLIPHSQVRH